MRSDAPPLWAQIGRYDNSLWKIAAECGAEDVLEGTQGTSGGSVETERDLGEKRGDPNFRTSLSLFLDEMRDTKSS